MGQVCGCASDHTTSEVYLPSNYYPYEKQNLQYQENNPRTFFDENSNLQTQNTQQQYQFDQYPLNSYESLDGSQPKQTTRRVAEKTQQMTQREISFNNTSGNAPKQSVHPFSDVVNSFQGENSPIAEVSPFSACSGGQTQIEPEVLIPQWNPPKYNTTELLISQQNPQKYNIRVQKLAEIVAFAPILKLTVLASANLKKGQILTINAQGIMNGLRNEKDGYTYFGCKKKPKRVNKMVRQTLIVNDFIIPPTDPVQAKQQRGRHFQIKYDIANNFYTIVDLGVGFGAFKKLEVPHILRNHDLINFGLTLCTIKFVSLQNPNKSFAQNAFQDKSQIILRAQFYGGVSNGELYELNPSEFQEATIGRSDSCSLVFKDKLISKIQCLLQFNPTHGWILKDGDGQLPSTNSTWLYLQKEEQIVEGMIIKSNQTMFHASVL